MTHRDVRWRALGGLLMAAGAAVGAFHQTEALRSTSVFPLAGFALAIAGLVLAVQGKRVPLAFRIERSRHRGLPSAIRARRRR